MSFSVVEKDFSEFHLKVERVERPYWVVNALLFQRSWPLLSNVDVGNNDFGFFFDGNEREELEHVFGCLVDFLKVSMLDDHHLLFPCVWLYESDVREHLPPPL